MEISTSEIANIAKAFQGFAAGLAIMVGGGWALYRFSVLDEIKKAKLELTQKEQDLLQQPVVDLRINAKQVILPHDAGFFIEINVIAKNQGN